VRPRHDRPYRLAGLAWRIQPGKHLIETPVGDVTATLHEDGSVSVENVPAYRWRKQVQVKPRTAR
jgi:4-hydroxyproline epimerase